MTQEFKDTNFVSISDIGFKKALVALGIIADEKSEITHLEAKAYTGKMNISGFDIENLSEIAIFENITELDCSNNALKALDLSRNKALKNLDVSDNDLEMLDLTNNPFLERLDCFGNLLKGLDLSQNTVLKHLDCSNNRLEILDLSKNTQLESLECRWNVLKYLDWKHIHRLQNFNFDINLQRKTEKRKARIGESKVLQSEEFSIFLESLLKSIKRIDKKSSLSYNPQKMMIYRGEIAWLNLKDTFFVRLLNDVLKRDKLEKHLKKVIAYTFEQMEKYEVDYTLFFTKSRRYKGCCFGATKKIALVLTYGRSNFYYNLADVKNTILHEIAHAVVGVRYGHRKEWQDKAREMGVTWTKKYRR
ncbi:hypothetical protein CGC48_01490 [Capnocytophaga cynodegmi]|uniref:SprT-like domain-containing protein n=1 Tax=Capnocytophaga cynodegmi TaxID=28189 RepID=A0A286NTM6_9FLAO|nr:hypothetical protein [Capnocytophaga cynodegmi]ATA67413.1 hypothetical protein CGC48_01490 [Capnocytophaga cynodegmi]